MTFVVSFLQLYSQFFYKRPRNKAATGLKEQLISNETKQDEHEDMKISGLNNED